MSNNELKEELNVMIERVDNHQILSNLHMIVSDYISYCSVLLRKNEATEALTDEFQV